MKHNGIEKKNTYGSSDLVEEEKHPAQNGGKEENVNNIVMAGLMQLFLNDLNFLYELSWR